MDPRVFGFIISVSRKFPEGYMSDNIHHLQVKRFELYDD